MFATRAFSLVVAVALLFANQAYAAGTVEARAALTATNSVAACNPPNNGNHHVGSSCKFFTGPSDKSPVHHGHCQEVNGVLTCV